MAPSKKRKVSDLTAGDTNTILSALDFFQGTLDENDEDLPSDLLPSLAKLRAKIEVIQHTSFSKVDAFTLVETRIRSGPLFLDKSQRKAIEDLGKADAEATLLSFNITKVLIELIRDHVSTVTEAGCRILINVILLRLVSAMQSQDSQINIIPEFPIPKTTFSTNTGEQSFGGVVDFLLATVPPRYSRFLLNNPVGALANPASIKWPLTPTILEAKKDNIALAIPQATVAVAAYCKQHNLPVLRGCITSGEQWAFFIYQANGDGGQVSMADEINLGVDLENLPLVLGLLRDLVENALVYEQKYFSYE